MTFIQKRNIATCIILSLVTCGIYMIYWDYKVAVEAVKVRDETDDGLLEGLLAIFFPPIGFFLAERKLSEGANAKGLSMPDNSIIYLIIGLFGFSIISAAIMQNDLNKLADCVPVGGTGYYDATNQFDPFASNGGFNPNAQAGGYGAPQGGFDPSAQAGGTGVHFASPQGGFDPSAQSGFVDAQYTSEPKNGGADFKQGSFHFTSPDDGSQQDGGNANN